MIPKAPVLLAVMGLLAWCADTRGQLLSPLPPKAERYSATDDRVGWVVKSFIELAKEVKADCVTEALKVLRCAGPVRIDGLHRTLVSGHGLRIEFSDARPGRGGILLVSAADVELAHIEIGWLNGGARDPIVAGAQRIQSYGDVGACSNGAQGGTLVLDLPVEGTQPLGAVTVWDDAIGWPWYQSAPDAVEVYFASGAQVSFSGGRSNCLVQLAGLVGRRVLVRHLIYANPALQCWGCRNVTVAEVRVTSAPGAAFLFANGGSGLVLRRDVVEPGCWPHCRMPEPSITADAAHFAAVEGNISLEGNDFGWQGDDSVNITGMLIPANLDLQTQEEPGRSLSVDPQWRDRISLLAIGRKVLLFDHGLSERGEAEILSVDPPSGHMRVSQLPDNLTEPILAPADLMPKNIAIRGNHFHDNRARGILMGGSDAVIENNVIERVTAEAILIPADVGPWYEGPGAQNVVIKNNRISDVNRYPDARNYPSAISAGVAVGAEYAGAVGKPIRHIVVEANTFSRVYSNPEVPVFFGKGVEDGRLRGK